MKKFSMLTTFVAIVLSITLISCGSDKPKISAQDYNNNLITIQMNVVNKILALSKTFEKLVPAEMEAGLKQFQESVDKAIAEVAKIEAYDGDSSLKDAVTNLLKFYQAASVNEYKQMIDILKKGAAITPEDQNILVQIGEKISSQEKGLDDAMKAAQSAFAKKNNFTIETNDKQKEIDNLGK